MGTKSRRPGEEPVKTLDLPALEISPIGDPVGRIFHVLALGGIREISKIDEILISKRKKENLYHLSDGQKIIVTTRSKLQRPRGVDGVLQVGGQIEWLSHRLIDEFYKQLQTKGLRLISTDIAKGWTGAFSFQSEQKDDAGNILSTGLRPAQIGSLHAIGAHWSLNRQPATVVMPTGTGKTETILSTLVAYMPGVVLIVVPSRILRDQTISKLKSLGLLRSLGNLKQGSRNPIVGVIKKRPKSEGDLDILQKCNVVVSTMSVFAEADTLRLGPAIAQRIDTLIVDEAHHIAADGWTAFREHFIGKKVLQFTATPYRRDGKLVDGKVIFDYPLHVAQQDGYFKRISFEPVYEIDQEEGDRAIADAAVNRLRTDIAAGLNHSVMARCANIERAVAVYRIYQEVASTFNPVIIHISSGDPSSAVEQLRSGQSKIVVCVNMLGEGFDLPQLKIAAVHDMHRSLSVLLQFTGRFTRSAGDSIGHATVIANIADQEVSSALERLYSEDANWNQLLSEYSSEASRAHAELVEFLNASQRIDEPKNDNSIEISHHLLRPILSTLVFESPKFKPKEFFRGIPAGSSVHRVWLHRPTNTLYFVTRTEPLIQWTRSRELRDLQWDLFVLHHDSKRNLLFLSSNDKSSFHEKLAFAVGATRLISGDVIFRTLGRINRLMFQNVGVRKHGRRNLRFAMYTGADVAEALSVAERAGSVKSNLSGSGWENGRPVTIGCSLKGRIWSRDQGTIPEFVRWCATVGDKLQDSAIDTTKIIANVLIPEEVDRVPDKQILSLEWPLEILRQSEERVTLQRGQEELPLSMFDLCLLRSDVGKSLIEFQLFSLAEENWGTFSLTVGGDEGFRVTRTSRVTVGIRVGRLEASLEEYLSSYPPMIRFVDLSELDGNLLIKPQSTQELVFPPERFEVWDWDGVDTRKESIWKGQSQREDSIQWRAASHFIKGGYEIVFDDDAAGEAADLICLKEEDESIRLTLVHCKFTKGNTSGERVTDVVEVCSQAVRSAKWKWKFRDLCRHVIAREKNLAGRQTRFLAGRINDLNRFVKVSRFKEIKAEIVIVQPGISCEHHTADQASILASAHSYLKETIGVDLDVVCGA